MKGWLVRNSYFCSPSTTELVRRFEERFRRCGCELLVLKSNELLFCVDEQGKIEQKTNYFRPDFVLFWDKDLNLARLLEKWGVRVYNRSQALAVCDDKNYTYAVLAEQNIPLIPTIFSPVVYYNLKSENDASFLNRVEEAFGYPVVVKAANGSFGAQVYLAHNREELQNLRKKMGSLAHCYQKYIAESAGSDVRMVFLKDRLVACMHRYNTTDFRANVEQGGACEEFVPSPEAVELGKKVMQCIGLDYAGIDFMPYRGGYVVCEVNSNAYVKGISTCTGVDVAQAYVDYILEDAYVKN